MKKHPVDDLFKSKLSELEKRPSTAAWLRIQNEQRNTKPRFVGWVWYAAASVAIAIISGFLVWQETQKSFRNNDNQGTIAIVKESEKIDRSIVSDSLVKPNDYVLEKTGESQIAAADIKKNNPKLSKRAYTKPVIQQGSRKSELQNNAINVVPETKFIAGINPKDILINVPEPAVLLTNIEKEVLSEQVAAIADKKENHTIIVSIDAEEGTNEKPKSRFAKVFRQLKNARAGDPVDWKDVGFNPKVIIARVDEKVRNKEEVISEKYQNIKGRTKL